MAELKEVEISIETILPIVVEYRNRANRTTHELSKSTTTEVRPCTDDDVAKFLYKINKPFVWGQAELVISGIDWEEFGNCIGDELYPVLLKAIRLPDLKRWYMELTGLNIYKEYILNMPNI